MSFTPKPLTSRSRDAFNNREDRQNSKMIITIIVIVIVIALIFLLVWLLSNNNTSETPTPPVEPPVCNECDGLDAPTNIDCCKLSCTNIWLISWNDVEHADCYQLEIDYEDFDTAETGSLSVESPASSYALSLPSTITNNTELTITVTAVSKVCGFESMPTTFVKESELAASLPAWGIDIRGNNEFSIDIEPFIANTNSISPFDNSILIHKFDGEVGQPYEVQLTVGTNDDGDTCNLVIEEAPPNELWAGVYTAAAQVMHQADTAPLDNITTLTRTVTPTITDSMWMYTCQGDATTFPMTLKVVEG